MYAHLFRPRRSYFSKQNLRIFCKLKNGFIALSKIPFFCWRQNTFSSNYYYILMGYIAQSCTFWIKHIFFILKFRKLYQLKKKVPIICCSRWKVKVHVTISSVVIILDKLLNRNILFLILIFTGWYSHTLILPWTSKSPTGWGRTENDPFLVGERSDSGDFLDAERVCSFC